MANPFFLAQRKEKTLIFFGIIAGVFESASDPVGTILIGKMFKDIQDVGVGAITRDDFLKRSQMWTYCLIGVCFYTMIVSTIAYNIWSYLGYSFGHKARKKLFRSLTVNSLPWFDENNNLSGTASAHFKDIQDLEGATGVASYQIIVMTINCLAQVGVAFYYSWAVTLICLVGIPVLIIICAALSPSITKFILQGKTVQEDTATELNWVLGSLETVRIFQKDRIEWVKVFQLMVKQCKVNIKYWLFFRMQEGVSRILVLLVFLQGFYFGSYMVREHGLSAGNVVTVFWSCLSAASLVQTVVGHLIEWNKGKASAERLIRVYTLDEAEVTHNAIGIMPDTKYEIDQVNLYPLEIAEAMMIWGADAKKCETTSSQEDSKSCTTLVVPRKVVFDEVVFSYTSRRNLVLRGLSMEFLPGDITFVLGQSGSGKSTIAALLSKQYPFIAGSIEIDDHPIELMSNAWIKENVHICEQSPQLFDISIFDNITLGEEFDADRIQTALMDSCAGFVFDLPEKGLTSGSYPLSGGQIQRISLARARYLNAPITIYDESTSALDSRTQDEVFRSIFRYRTNKTTIIITHNPSLIPEGYPVYIMDKGFATRYSDITQAKELDSSYCFGLEKEEKENLDSNQDTSNVDWDDNAVVSEDAKLAEEVRRNHDKPKNGKLPKIEYRLVLESMPSKFILFCGFAFSIIHAVINPIFSYVFSKLVMGVIAPGTQVTLWAMLVLMCSIVDGICSFGKVMLNIAAEKWLLEVKTTIVDRIIHFPGSRINNEDTSYYVKLLVSDAEKTADIITYYWPAIASMLVIGTTGFVWSMIVGWKLSLVGISLLPAFVALNQGYKFLVKYWTERRERRRADVIRLVMDLTSAQGYRTMKTQHLEYYFKRIFYHREAQMQKLLPKMITQIGISFGVLRSIPFALESLLLWYGTYLIGKGFPTNKVITVFTLLMFTVVTVDQLSGSIGGVGPGFEAFPRLLSAYTGKDKLTVGNAEETKVTKKIEVSRIKREEREKEDEDENQIGEKTEDISTEIQRTDTASTSRSRASETREPVYTMGRRNNAMSLVGSANAIVVPNTPYTLDWQHIAFYDLGVIFANGQHALGNFSCEVSSGETVAIVGPSGVGKSTIGRILEMMEPNYTGSIVVDHEFELKDISLFEIRRSICLVSQMPLDFFDGTIEENLLYALDVNDRVNVKERIIDACKISGIHDFINGMGDKYETKMTNGGLLSGGQKQRLGIARALLRNPKVLILDECTSALDPTSKNIILNTIEKLKSRRDMIIIIISHELEVAAVADRIVRIRPN